MVKGRQTIFSDLALTDENIPAIINQAMDVHLNNARECNYLINYYLGEQSILNREKDIRPEIRNDVVMNFAWQTVRDVKGYVIGNGVKYVLRSLKEQDELNKLNTMFNVKEKTSVDMDLMELMLVCGVAYRFALADNTLEEEEGKFKLVVGDPRNTFVVRSREVGNEVKLACTFYDVDEETPAGIVRYTVYEVFTNKKRYRYKAVQGYSVTEEELVEGYPMSNIYKNIPIEEYSCNMWKTGIFEPVITILDAINTLASNYTDDIEQNVNAKLVISGIDARQLNEEILDSEGNVIGTGRDAIISRDLITFSGDKGIEQKVYFVNTDLDYNGTQNLITLLKEELLNILGIPDRKTRGNGGGDTGQAVMYRDGWASLETVAKGIEGRWKLAERQMLKTILTLLKTQGAIKNLSTYDINIEFSRNKLDNLLNKVQAGALMNSMELYDPVDITNLMDIVSNAQEMVERGKEYWDAKHKENEEKAVKMAEMNKPEETEAEKAGEEVAKTDNQLK